MTFSYILQLMISHILILIIISSKYFKIFIEFFLLLNILDIKCIFKCRKISNALLVLLSTLIPVY